MNARPPDRSSLLDPWRSRLGALLTRGSFRRNVAIVALAATGGQVISLVASPLLTRLYDPAQFGVLAVFVAMVSTLASIGSLNYWVAVTLPEDDDSAANLVALSILIGFLLSVLTGVILLGFSDLISEVLEVPSLDAIIWLIPISVCVASAYFPLSAWAARKQEYGRIARTKIVQAAWQAAVQVGVGFAGGGTWGLVLGDALGRTGGSGSLALGGLRDCHEAGRRISMSRMKSVALRYKRFPMFSSGSLLLNNLGQALPVFLLAAIYGPQVAGFFALGQRIIAVPMRTIGQSVAQVYIGHASSVARGESGDLERIFSQTRNRLLKIGAIPLLLMAVAGRWLFPLIFGAEWSEAGLFVQILSVMFLFQFVAVPISQTLNILERQDLQLYWDVGRLLIVLIAFGVPYAMGLGPRIAIAMYALGATIAYALLLLLIQIAIRSAERAVL